jgi:putative GTP pyrophosphokinase
MTSLPAADDGLDEETAAPARARRLPDEVPVATVEMPTLTSQMLEDPTFELERMRAARQKLDRMMVVYQSGLDQVMTKLEILRREFQHIRSYNPIEHVSSRLKTPESLIEKIRRRGLDPADGPLSEQVTDIAGVRVVCSFVSDVYRVQEMLCSQPDIEVLQVKDYIARPKPNGYRSLHIIAELDVYLSDRVERVPVEIQFRTIAMDFWASLEHKISYKYAAEIPAGLLHGLHLSAETAAMLDRQMEDLHSTIRGDGGDPPAPSEDVPAGTAWAIARFLEEEDAWDDVTSGEGWTGSPGPVLPD